MQLGNNQQQPNLHSFYRMPNRHCDSYITEFLWLQSPVDHAVQQSGWCFPLCFFYFFYVEFACSCSATKAIINIMLIIIPVEVWNYSATELAKSLRTRWPRSMTVLLLWLLLHLDQWLVHIPVCVEGTGESRETSGWKSLLACLKFVHSLDFEILLSTEQHMHVLVTIVMQRFKRANMD